MSGEDKHGFSTKMGIALAIDGFVIEIVKPYDKVLNRKDVATYRNVIKGFWGLISQRLDAIQKC